MQYTLKIHKMQLKSQNKKISNNIHSKNGVISFSS